MQSVHAGRHMIRGGNCRPVIRDLAPEGYIIRDLIIRRISDFSDLDLNCCMIRLSGGFIKFPYWEVDILETEITFWKYYETKVMFDGIT